jgi:hypothetical protein
MSKKRRKSKRVINTPGKQGLQRNETYIFLHHWPEIHKSTIELGKEQNLSKSPSVHTQYGETERDKSTNILSTLGACFLVKIPNIEFENVVNFEVKSPCVPIR